MRSVNRAAMLTWACVLAIGVAGCGDDDDNGTGPTDPTPSTVSIVSGADQTVGTGETSEALTVRVLDEDSNPVAGTTVTFTGSGVVHTLSALSALTGSDGQASVTVTAGTVAGAVEVQAAVSGVAPVTFSLQVEAPPVVPTTISVVAGDGQSLAYNGVSGPIIVEVRDQDNAPAEGIAVAFAGSGVAHTLSAETAQTGADGRAQITVTAGIVPGDITVEATVEGLDPVSAGLTVEDAPFSIPAPDNVRGVVFDGTWLWAAGGPDASPVIFQLDPTDGSVESSFNAPAPDHRDLTWDGTNLWYSSNGGNIYQLNPANGVVLSTIPSPGDQPRGLAWVGTSLWHTARTGGAATIYRLFPENGAVLAEFPSPLDDPLGFTSDGVNFWTTFVAADPAGRTLNQLDATGGFITSLPNPGTFPIGLAYDPAGPFLWTADPVDETIYRVTINP